MAPASGDLHGMRLMAVHAHPDDEVEGTGGLLALTALRGGTTSVVTMTNGDLGRVGDDLRPDPVLALERSGEQERACAALGVGELVRLHWGDSGMAGDANNGRPGTLTGAPFEAVVDQLVHHIRSLRPHVVVTYDENGGYGHPDHVVTHRATARAYELAARPSYKPELGRAWMVRKLYYTSFPQSQLDATLSVAQERGLPDPRTQPQAGCFAVTPAPPTTTVDCRAVFASKLAAMREHGSQYPPDFVVTTLPLAVSRDVFGVEHFRLARTRGVNAVTPEVDVFAGLVAVKGPRARGAAAAPERGQEIA